MAKSVVSCFVFAAEIADAAAEAAVLDRLAAQVARWKQQSAFRTRRAETSFRDSESECEMLLEDVVELENRLNRLDPAVEAGNNIKANFLSPEVADLQSEVQSACLRLVLPNAHPAIEMIRLINVSVLIPSLALHAKARLQTFLDPAGKSLVSHTQSDSGILIAIV